MKDYETIGNCNDSKCKYYNEKMELNCCYSSDNSKCIQTEKPINSGYPLLGDVAGEMNHAISKFPAFHSLHEGYAIMLEEVDELWEHVKTNQTRRDKEAIKKECIQIAAMALRIILDCGDMDK